MNYSKFLVPVCVVALWSGCAAIDRSERNTLLQHNVSPFIYDRMVQGEVLTLSDIIELSKRQVPGRLVINYLYSTRAVYSLDKPGLARLREGGVDQSIINYLLDTPSIFAPRPYYAGRVYDAPYYGPYYPYDPYYPRFYGGSSVIIVNGHRHWR
jgi:hypothetical protein